MKRKSATSGKARQGKTGKPAEPGAESLVAPEVLERARRLIAAEPPKPAAKCIVCAGETAQGAADRLCWVCRRLKISAWRDASSSRCPRRNNPRFSSDKLPVPARNTAAKRAVYPVTLPLRTCFGFRNSFSTPRGRADFSASCQVVRIRTPVFEPSSRRALMHLFRIADTSSGFVPVEEGIG